MPDRIDVISVKLDDVKSTLDQRLGAMMANASGGAVFKTKMADENRIIIPDPEIEVLGLEEGDLLQVTVQKDRKKYEEVNLKRKLRNFSKILSKKGK